MAKAKAKSVAATLAFAKPAAKVVFAKPAAATVVTKRCRAAHDDNDHPLKHKVSLRRMNASLEIESDSEPSIDHKETREAQSQHVQSQSHMGSRSKANADVERAKWATATRAGNCLDVFSRDLFDSLSKEELCQLQQLPSQVSCGSACTGSGMDWHVAQALQARFQEHGIETKFPHLWMSDIVPKIRDFLCNSIDEGGCCVFGDMQEIPVRDSLVCRRHKKYAHPGQS